LLRKSKSGHEVHAFLVALLVASVPALAQNPQVARQPNPAFPTVTFSWALWGATPPQYSLSVASSGNATYKSMPRSTAKTGVPYTLEFLISQPTRTKIFDLVQELNFLSIGSKDGRLSARDKSVKTISFRQADIHNQIMYQDSNNPRVRELASTFESIAATLEFGRRLADLHQHREARLADELKRMHNLVDQGKLRELQAINEVLKNIASDSSLDQGVRGEAQTILNSSH
jgi:hypothetical protein